MNKQNNIDAILATPEVQIETVEGGEATGILFIPNGFDREIEHCWRAHYSDSPNGEAKVEILGIDPECGTGDATVIAAHADAIERAISQVTLSDEYHWALADNQPEYNEAAWGH